MIDSRQCNVVFPRSVAHKKKWQQVLCGLRADSRLMVGAQDDQRAAAWTDGDYSEAKEWSISSLFCRIWTGKVSPIHCTRPKNESTFANCL